MASKGCFGAEASKSEFVDMPNNSGILVFRGLHWDALDLIFRVVEHIQITPILEATNFNDSVSQPFQAEDLIWSPKILLPSYIWYNSKSEICINEKNDQAT